MAVAFGSSVTSINISGASKTTGSLSVSGSNPAIIVCVSKNAGSSQHVSSVSWSLGSGTPYQVGQALNPATSILLVEIWAIPAPTTGSGTVTVNLTATNSSWDMAATAVTGADQTTPCPTGDFVSSIATFTSLTLTPTNLTANDATIMVHGEGNVNVNSITGQILRDNTGSIGTAVGSNTGTTGVSETLSSSSANHAAGAARIQAAGGVVVINSNFFAFF